MKTIHKFTLKSYLGPMILTFFIVMFILMMNFVWRYIDELVGKGLDFGVIMELLFYATANMMPMGIPLATLFAAIMTMGNLGENSELLAMKSAGMSLPRILTPLIVVVVLVAIGSFFVVNNLVPYSNKKMHTIIYDIRKQKEVLEFKDGIFFNGIDDMSIRVEHQNPKTKLLNDVLIYDTRDGGGNMSTTIADSGYIYLSDDKSFLMVILYNGETYETTRNRKWDTESALRHQTFVRQDAALEMRGFDFERTEGDIFTGSGTQDLEDLTRNIDSLQLLSDRSTARSYEPLLKNHLLRNDQSAFGLFDTVKVDYSYKKKVNLLDSLVKGDPYEKHRIWKRATNLANSSTSALTFNENNAKDDLNQLYRYKIDWHKKVSLPISIIIFFLIGAPLGAIIRKGGLAMPVVVSVLFFVFYYIVSMMGEKMSKEGTWDTSVGMWVSSIILAPIAMYLTYIATNDSNLFNIDWYIMKFQKLRHKLLKIKTKHRKVVDSKSLRIVYMGTPDFAVASLRALVDGGYNVVGVVTVPDKSVGRGQKTTESAVKKYALEAGIPILQPESLKSKDFIKAFRALKSDLGIVIAFRMLPEIVWSAPKLGTFNLHASLLPQYRGAAPINWAIIHGETRTGVTTFMLNKKIDEGEIIGQREVDILPTDNVGSMHDKLMNVGVELVLDTINKIASNTDELIDQKGMLITGLLKPAPKIFKSDCQIDFSDKGVHIKNLVRGLSPYPAAWAQLSEELSVKIFDVDFEPKTHKLEAGTILSDGKESIKVACKDGFISIKDLQFSGKKRMSTAELLMGFRDIEQYKFS